MHELWFIIKINSPSERIHFIAQLIKSIPETREFYREQKESLEKYCLRIKSCGYMGINKQYQNSNPSIDREAPDPNLAPCHISFPTKGFSFNQKKYWNWSQIHEVIEIIRNIKTDLRVLAYQEPCKLSTA